MVECNRFLKVLNLLEVALVVKKQTQHFLVSYTPYTLNLNFCYWSIQTTPRFKTHMFQRE